MSCPSADWKQTANLPGTVESVRHYKTCKKEVQCKAKPIGSGFVLLFQKDDPLKFDKCTNTLPGAQVKAGAPLPPAPGPGPAPSPSAPGPSPSAPGPAPGPSAPAPTDCSPSSAGDYKCNQTIGSDYNLGNDVKKGSWQECQTMCNEDPKCVAWTLNNTKECQKKTSATYVYQKDYISGPRSTAAAGTTTSGSPSPDGQTTTKPPTDPPSSPSSWWSKKSPLGIAWWIVVLIVTAFVLLCMCSVCGMIMLRD